MKWTHYVFVQVHPQYHVLQQGKYLSYPPDCVDKVTDSPICMGGEGLHPLPTFIKGAYLGPQNHQRF